MKSEFEEKTYETYFNSELSRKSSFFFPVGQVQEGFLGFDSAANSKSRRLWRRIGFPYWFFLPFKGTDLRSIADEMEMILSTEIEHFPKMKVNILFQYKRSEYIKKSNGTEWSNWNQPYFRYNVYRQQQDLLMQIHNKFIDDVLILYAAPAIYQMDDLVESFQNARIINRTNFRKADELDRHKKNTFIESGTHSIACSDPEKFNNFDLFELIKNFQSSNKEKDNRNFIIKFRMQLEEIIKENPKIIYLIKILNKPFEKIREFELFFSFIYLSNFRLITGLQWLVNLENDTTNNNE